MKDTLVMFGLAGVAIACCFAVSLVAATSLTTVLALAGVAFPLAAMIGVAVWAVWYRSRRLGQR